VELPVPRPQLPDAGATAPDGGDERFRRQRRRDGGSLERRRAGHHGSGAVGATARRGRARAAGVAATTLTARPLALPFATPFDWDALLGFLAARAIPGVESVEDGRYRRRFATGAAHGIVEVRLAPDARSLHVAIEGDRDAEADVLARVRRLFDLDADSAAIDAHLARDPLLRARVRARPGVRVPGAWDGFEVAVRAVLGQQVSVAGATTIAGRLVAACGAHAGHAGGSCSQAFPTPLAVATCDLSQIGLTRARAASLRGLGAAASADPSLFAVDVDLDTAIAKLVALPGIGPWTAHYVAMRALRHSDAFPASDLGLLRALAVDGVRPGAAALLALAERWRPYRAYAALRLWTQA
jgi:AraC family transcriptional regulator of adaptative response / DNA-3-methyladenine glycosylase II